MTRPIRVASTQPSADTARQALAIDPRRFAGLTIWNNEADEKVGFEVPYAPRIDERGAAWLAAVAVIHDQLGERYREADLRFAAAADNANLQLVQSPFDGRRSIMTRVGTSETDLLKVPAYGFYELLRLLGDRHGDGCLGGRSGSFPHTDLYHLATVADHPRGLAAHLLPRPGDRSRSRRRRSNTSSATSHGRGSTSPGSRSTVSSSNAYTAAGGSASNPFPVPAPAQIPVIRRHQEIALARPIARDIAVPAGTYAETLTLEPFTTLCLWITPVLATAPRAPKWLETTVAERERGITVESEPGAVFLQPTRYSGCTMMSQRSAFHPTPYALPSGSTRRPHRAARSTGCAPSAHPASPVLLSSAV